MTLIPFADRILPVDAASATLIARVFDPAVGGPCVAAVRGETAVDITAVAPTVSDLLDRADLLEVVRGAPAGRVWDLAELIRATLADDRRAPRLLAPIDLQVVKAAGVTFVRSMLERVVEERAKGDPGRAEAIRAKLGDVLQGTLAELRPGSPEAAEVKALLVKEGLWS